MFYDNLLSVSGDPILPDLIPEDPLFENLTSINDWTMPITSTDVTELTRKLDSLTITSNTQELRVEIERVKRQKLQASIRQVRREIAIMNPVIIELRDELKHLKETQNSINYQLDGENTRTNTLAFRSLSRVCEILTAIVSIVPLSLEPSIEVKTLLHELAMTIQHFGVYYVASQ